MISKRANAAASWSAARGAGRGADARGGGSALRAPATASANTMGPVGTSGVSNVAGLNSQIDQLVGIIQNSESSSSERITACEVVRSYVDFQSLSSVTELWYSASCLLNISNPAAVRRSGWRLTRSCIAHDELNNSAFTMYYTAIVRKSNVEDFDLVISCLDLLTNSGRRVVGSQAPRQLPSVLIGWIQLLALRTQKLRTASTNASVSNGSTSNISTNTSASNTSTSNTSVSNSSINASAGTSISLSAAAGASSGGSVGSGAAVSAAGAAGSNPSEASEESSKNSSVSGSVEQSNAGNSSSGDYLSVPSTASYDVALSWGVSTEENFFSVMQYTISLLKFRMSIWEPLEIEKLVLVVVAIVRQTSQASDCRLCCEVMHAVMAFGLLPAPVLQPVLEVLCGMAVAVPGLRATCEANISELSRSHLRNSTFVRLCRIVDTTSREITVSMRAEAAARLCDLVVANSVETENAPAAAASTSEGDTIGDALAPQSLPLEVEIPTVEILESYYSVLKETGAPYKLVLAILRCFRQMLKRLDLLTWVAVTCWRHNDSCVSSLDVVLEFSHLYHKFEKQGEDVKVYFEEMQSLAQTLASTALSKTLNTSTSEHLGICISLSEFMDAESCTMVLKAVAFLQFCTPGITDWFQHIQEVIQRIYAVRTDCCRIKVLEIVEHVFSLDTQLDQDWVSQEQRLWITNAIFSVVGSADSETLSALLKLYRQPMFFTVDLNAFKLATSLLVNACVAEDANVIIALPQRIIDALIEQLAESFRIYPQQSLVLLNAFVDICLKAKSREDVFARSWAVLSRIRTDRWDSIVFVDHTAEASYGKTILGMQEPFPRYLQPLISRPSLVLKCRLTKVDHPFVFDSTKVIAVMIDVLSSPRTCERSLVLVLINAVPFLAHSRLLQSADEETFVLLRLLRDILSSFVASGGARFPCNVSSTMKNALLCVSVHILTVLMPYESLYSKQDRDKLMLILVQAMNQWNLSTGWATHCFTVACYEASTSLQRYLPQILSRLQLKITSRDSSMYILDFMLTLSQEEALTNNFNEQDFKRLFGMCFSFIQDTNYQLTFQRKCDIAAKWMLRLAYSSIAQLFLSMRLENRRSLVPYLLRSLILVNGNTKVMNQNSLVMYDMITRFTYSDLPLRAHMDTIPKLDPSWEVRRWLWNFTVLELRCNRITGDCIKIIRKPAGIFTISLRPSIGAYSYDHPDETPNDLFLSDGISSDNYTANFFLLGTQIGLGALQFGDRKGHFPAQRDSKTQKKNQKADDSNTGNNNADQGSSANGNSGAGLAEADGDSRDSSDVDDANSENESGSKGDENDLGPIPGTSMPLALPDDAATNRAISAIDRVPIVDFFKIGIIYCAPGQRLESEFLANQSGSLAYLRFVRDIGELIRLKHNRQYYVGGLDTEQDLDGEYAIAWSSKVSQIIFHTTTMMPTYQGDQNFASKKRHIGNDFVNIYFDESGNDFEFDVVKSQFNFINIVISPTYYVGKEPYWKLRVYQKPGMVNTSAAFDLKIVKEKHLALFVRNLALKLSLYASIHNDGGEYTDNWVYRLQLITTLRERVLKQTEEQYAAEQQEIANAEAAEEGGQGANKEKQSGQEIELLKWADFTQFTK